MSMSSQQRQASIMRPSPLPRPHEGPSSIVCVSVFPGCLSFPARFASLGRKRERETEREISHVAIGFCIPVPYVHCKGRCMDGMSLCILVPPPRSRKPKNEKKFPSELVSTCSYLVRWMYCTSVGRYSSRFFFLLSLMISQVIFIITYKWFEYILW